MIDVIIPAYDCGATIDKCLASLMCQIDMNFKVILVDDNSDIPLNNMINRYNIDILYIRNTKNYGCGLSRQIGINNATSDYIIFLDADDILMPYAIKLLNDAIKQQPNGDVYYAGFYQLKDSKLQTNLMDNTHCHGKCYSRKFLTEFNITASDKIKFADDSYFNSIVLELSRNTIMLKYPIYIWIRNQYAITYSKSFKDQALADFINAMVLSIQKLLDHKSLEDIRFTQTVADSIISQFKHQYVDLPSIEKHRSIEAIKQYDNIANTDIYSNVKSLI
jgi:glycosyltransferase involved in cell wall biosynthesis